MNSIRSYIDMIEPRLLHHIQGAPKEFIHLFKKKVYISEDVFMQKFCAEKHNQRHYRHVKTRTIKILQALAIISRSTGMKTVQKKLDFCRKNFTIGQKFLDRGLRKEGFRLIKDAYKIAVAYDFVYLACELSSIMYHNYTYYQPNINKANFYATQVQKYLQDYTAEKKAEHYFYHVIGKIGGSLKSVEYGKILGKINECRGESLTYKVYQSMIEVFYGFSIKDYNLIIKSCRQALTLFKTTKGVYNSHYLFFLMNIGKAQMAFGQYNQAAMSFIQSEDYTLTKSINKALVQLHKALNALHAGEYQKAYDLYRENRKCSFETIREQFAIIEAYLCFLSYMGYLELKSPFRLGKYLNDTFKAQTDKEGSNINIIIAELLIYFTRDRGKFIDRIEAVQNYTYRYLNTQDTRRAKRFIKILCLLPKSNFHPIALERNAKRHIQYLKDHPISMGENVAIEVLPFECVLEMIMENLAIKAAQK